MHYWILARAQHNRMQKHPLHSYIIMNRNLQEGATGSLTYTWEKVAVLYFHKYMLQIVTNICILFLLMDLRCELVKMADVI